MANCPSCEADMDLDEEDLQAGGEVICGDCGAHFEVVSPQPLELEKVDDEEDEDDDEDDDDEEDDDDLDDDDEEEEEEGYDDEDDGYGQEEEDE